MANVMTGVAAAYGTDAATLLFVGAGSASVPTTETDMQKFGLTDEFDIDEAKNRFGNVKTRVGRNRRHKITITVLVQDTLASITKADALSKADFPVDMLGIVTLAGFGNTRIDGTWNYDGGGTINGGAGEYWELTLPLSRHGDVPASLAVVA